MTDMREQGLQVFRELLPGVLPDGDVDFRDGSFGDELLEIGIDNVFGRLWTRDGLSRRDRSLVTLGILIALRATDELRFHVQIARNNGLTEDEIAEVIYHATGYAGFPNASTAMKVAKEVLAEEHSRAADADKQSRLGESNP
ncbi:carboxymuconolactone decarboxylase family protein [Mycolicibacterium thermoresistibile]|nr:carboxymuconolactone decarboxylase family protein [Mycolicibacterium thermoresistibile]MCV7187069.1 carboxymuconolactone decarboxylase family protein [Mycolicibacterium thermoresistibile]GAT16323.1 carboxymuconolactone decarboxylase [Mycolicibacterium thermoresistibile]SNW20305.1 gamma-carboxymuconolactone decarboxylase subunit like protein [Mycolicibacterium thermoresistibile]